RRGSRVAGKRRARARPPKGRGDHAYGPRLARALRRVAASVIPESRRVSGRLLLGALVHGVTRLEHVRAAVEDEDDRRQVEIGQQRLGLTEEQRETVGLFVEL